MSEHEYTGIEGHEDDIAKATMKKANCAITKDVLKYLNNLSIKHEYNRQLIDSIFLSRADVITDVIDERFPLFLSMVVPHYHRAGVKTHLHYRTIWIGIMSNDTTKEHKFVVDIPATAFELLPEVPEIQYLTPDKWRDWWEQEKENITQEFIKQINEIEEGK